MASTKQQKMEKQLNSIRFVEDFLANHYTEICASVAGSGSKNDSNNPSVVTELNQSDINKVDITICQPCIFVTPLGESNPLIKLISKSGQYPSIAHAYASYLGTTEKLLENFAELNQPQNYEPSTEICGKTKIKTLAIRRMCGVCGMKFRSKKSLREHKSPFRVRRYNCHVCGQAYDRKSKLWNHNIRHHIGDNASFLYESIYDELTKRWEYQPLEQKLSILNN